MNLYKLASVVSVLALIMAFSESSACAVDPNTVKYFRTFAGYSIPFSPREEVDQADALLLPTYYRAEYANDGVIVLFQKYINGGLVFSDRYFYDADRKFKRRTITKASGETTDQSFDKSGRVIAE